MSVQFRSKGIGLVTFGIILGATTATGISIWANSCDVDTVLWFCNETPSVVDRTLELIQSTISVTIWPVVAVLIAVIFKGHLTDLLPRITKAGPTGVEFGAQKRAQTASPTSLEELEPIPNMVRTQAIAELEVVLHQELAKFDESSRVGLLVRELAQARLDFGFLDIYRMIFGSQYQLLKRLKTTGDRSREEVEEYFDSVQKSDGFFAERPMTEIIRFLEVRHLVIWKEDVLLLTAFGEDFLAFVFNRSLSENLPD